METWKPVVEFENYEVSSFGRLRSINPRKGSRANVNGGIVDGWIQTVRPGYRRKLVALRKDGKTYIKKVHRVVLEAFVGPCPDGMEALHINGDSLDNRSSNLRWGTHAENLQDMIAHGTRTKPPVHYGERHHNVTISSRDVRKIRKHTFKRGDLKSFADKYGVSTNTIARIRDGVSRNSE